MRITNKDVENVLERLNAVSKNKYSLEWAYGGVKLLKDDSREITLYRHTKKELYHIILAILKWSEQERD